MGYLVVSRPFFDVTRYTNSTQSELMEDYYRSGRMLMNLAMAVGRLVLAGRELTRLAGYTARVTELQAVLKVIRNLLLSFLNRCNIHCCGVEYGESGCSCMWLWLWYDTYCVGVVVVEWWMPCGAVCVVCGVCVMECVQCAL